MTQLYTNDTFENKKTQYLQAIADSKPGVHYLILHCGYDDEELRAITSSSKLRDTDRRVFTDQDFITAVKETGVQVVTWKQVREMSDKNPWLLLLWVAGVESAAADEPSSLVGLGARPSLELSHPHHGPFVAILVAGSSYNWSILKLPK